MFSRTRNLIKFRLERLLLRGTIYRLLLIAALIGIISVIGGAAVVLGHGEIDSYPKAIWWAFLRLTDPGYLGDDQGYLGRTVSTVLTVLGYVIFMGALVAILTQWLNETIRNLESGYTPIAQNDHLLVLGWTSRTPTIVAELLLSAGRVRRFLSRHDTRQLSVVLLAQQVSAQLRYELRDRVGKLFTDRFVTLRSGTPLRLEHLMRVDFMNAAAVLMPSDDHAPEDANAADTRAIKTLLSMSRHARELSDEPLPLVVAEILDARKIRVALQAYDGPVEVVASDMLAGSMLAAVVMNVGMSQVFHELLVEHGSGDVHIRDVPEFEGVRFGELQERFPHAIPIGIVRPYKRSYYAQLAPGAEAVLRADDRVVLLAGSHEAAAPGEVEEGSETRLTTPTKGEALGPTTRRVLILGWSSHVLGVIHELAAYNSEVELSIVSVVPTVEREQVLQSYSEDVSRLSVTHVESDFTIPAELRQLDPGSFDAILMVASDWTEDDDETDARIIVGYLLLRDLLRKKKRLPHIVVELSDEANAALFDGQHVEVVNTPLIVGRILTQVALRRELRAVYEDLFGVRGAEMAMREPGDYGIAVEEQTFHMLEHAVAEHGDILMGLRGPLDEDERETSLNPAKDSTWDLERGYQLVVLTNDEV